VQVVGVALAQVASAGVAIAVMAGLQPVVVATLATVGFSIYSGLARLRGTLVLLMAVERIEQFAAALLEGGRPAQTPVTVIQEGTLRTQRVVRADLATVADKVKSEGIRPPAIIVIGDIIKALQSGRYDPANTAVAISQTGGQCRASSYVSLLKKALVASGFPEVPVVSVSLGGIELNEQPGFKLNATRLLLSGLFATIYTDALSAVYTHTAVRELRKGDALAALNACLAEAGRSALGRPWVMFRLVKGAIRRFRRIPIRDGVFPRVGIVGEIYLKYNPFGNGNIVDWLISRGVEPVVPPILSFFIKRFVNARFNQEHFVERFDALRAMAYRSFEHIVDSVVGRVNRILSSFHSLRPFHPIRRTARRARRVLSLVNQYGECWLLPGEICLLAEDDVNHVVSLQPFGCIANHVLAKGVERRLKELYPELSVLYLDMDSGSSEVNSLNRLHFLVEGARRRSSRI